MPVTDRQLREAGARVKGLKRDVDEKRRRRDEAIVAVARVGMSYAEIARVTGLTKARISQIVRRG